MKLTNKQIQDLFHFTKKHYVEWYDLQSELVDHLANDIEDVWIEKPTLTFEEAKRKAFKKFGVFGFMNVVEQKRKSLGKRYFKLFWASFKEFFTIPKITLTISLFFTVLFLIKLTNHSNIVIIGLTILIIILPSIHMIRSRRAIQKKEKEQQRKYMFEEYISNLGELGVLIQVPFQVLTHFFNKEVWSYNMEIIFSILIVLLGLIFYVLVVVIPPKVRVIIAKEHPEYHIL